MNRRPLVLIPDQVIDGDGSALPPGSCIRLADGLIAAIGLHHAVSGGEAAELPLPGATITPGFIDLHGYLSIEPDRPEPMRRMFDPDLFSRRATAAAHMQTALASGVTMMRVMGEGHGLDATMASLVAAGNINGPDLVRCGAPVAPSGSHQSPPGGGADGAEAVRLAVCDRAREGVDFLKLVLTGGVNASGDAATTPLYGDAELDAFFEEADAHGLPVAVAAHGGRAVEMATRRGALTIEHCALFDEADLTALLASATTPVLTLTRFFAPDGIARSACSSPLVLQRLERAKTRLAWLCARLAEQGTPFGLGTDNMHGRISEDAALAVSLGLAPARAIAAITGLAARLLGYGTRCGFVRQGHHADLVALAGDPLADIRALGAVTRLWRKGQEIIPRAA
jgi:imidazolonepropionase-like amidohydrolase